MYIHMMLVCIPTCAGRRSASAGPRKRGSLVTYMYVCTHDYAYIHICISLSLSLYIYIYTYSCIACMYNTHVYITCICVCIHTYTVGSPRRAQISRFELFEFTFIDSIFSSLSSD